MTENRPARAFSYIRFSSKKQGEPDKDSYRRQVGMSERWAKEHGLEVDPLSFQDLGVSSFKGKNAREGGLSLFLAEIEKPNGLIRAGDYLLLEAMDRLTRMPVMDAVDLVRNIMAAGVIVVNVATDKVYSWGKLNKEAGLMGNLIGELQAANAYSRQLSTRIREAWQRKRDAAGAGEKTRHSCPGWLKWNANSRTYVTIPENAEIIRLVFHYFLRDGMSFKQICAKLIADGVHCFGKAKTWGSNYIGVILTQRTVLGERTVGEYDDEGRKILAVIKDYYPAVMDEETWFAAKRLLHDRSLTDKRNMPANGIPRVTNLFTGRLKCKVCNTALVIYASGANCTHLYAVCRRRRMDGTCPDGARIRYADIEQTVIGLVANELVASDLLIDAQAERELSSTATAITRIERALAEKEEEKRQLARSLASSDLADGARKVIHDELNSLDKETQALKQDLDAARQRARTLQSSLRTVEGSLEEIRRLANETDLDGRRRLRAAIANLVDKIVVGTQCSKQIAVHFRTGVIRKLQVGGPFRLSRPELVRVLDLNGKPTADTVEWDDVAPDENQIVAGETASPI